MYSGDSDMAFEILFIIFARVSVTRGLFSKSNHLVIEIEIIPWCLTNALQILSYDL